jgi:hypothetical protein
VKTVKEFNEQPRHSSGRWISREQDQRRGSAVQRDGGGEPRVENPVAPVVAEKNEVGSVPPRGKTPLDP